MKFSLFVIGAAFLASVGVGGTVAQEDDKEDSKKIIDEPDSFIKEPCKNSPLGFEVCQRRADLCRNGLTPSTLREFRVAAERCTQIIGAVMPKVGAAFVLQQDGNTSLLVQAIINDPSLWAYYMSCITSTNQGWQTSDAQVVGVQSGMSAWLEGWESEGSPMGEKNQELLQDLITGIQNCPEKTDAALTTCLVRACVKV